MTPNTVELKKVVVEAAGATLTSNALSAAYTAVIGTENVEVANFNVKAAQNSKVFIKDLAITPTGTLTFNTNSVSSVKLWKGTSLVKTMSSSQISGGVLTFTDLNEEIAANSTANYSITTSFVKNTDINGSSTVAVITAATVEDVDGKTVSVASSLPLTSARTVTLAGTGALYVSMDNNDVTTNKDTYGIGGTMTAAIASLKLRADNETVKVTKLTITGSTNLNGKVTELGLYDGSTLIGSTNVIATTSVIDISGDKLIVPMSAKNYYVKATLAAIGKDQTGVLNTATTFAVSAIEAQGYNSGDSLVNNGDGTLSSGEIGYDVDNNGSVASDVTTGVSKTLGILASKISAVSLVPNDGGSTAIATKIYSGQSANAAIIKLTADASSNKEANGDAIKTYLNAVKVKVATSSTMSAYTATIERVSGTAVATSSTSISGGYATFGGLSGTDYEIAPSTSAYFLVKIVPTFTTSYAGDASLTASLDGLDTDSLTWKDASSASAKNALRLGATNAAGTTISN
jgi:hypothetical protein